MDRKRQALEQKRLEEQQRVQELQEEGRRARRGDLVASSTAGNLVKGRGRQHTSILEGEGAAGVSFLRPFSPRCLATYNIYNTGSVHTETSGPHFILHTTLPVWSLARHRLRSVSRHVRY